jgi:serine/threonine-protein kinase
MRGETVSHYQVLEELGGGGMGVVYKALDTRLRRHVALKFLPAELTRHPAAKERFLLEARAASTLDHPNVCTVHEIDETPDGRLFIAMAYYQGQTLRQRIEQGPVPVPEALKIAVQTARGLEAAHRAGIVHRDVKPANIMLPAGGEVKVLDFGLAKLEREARRLTRTGTTMGTVAYMSPEQARGDAVDARSDLWSLGVLLFEMLTGRLPFKGERDHSLVYAILHDTPEPLRPLCPGVPRAVERLIERLLEKDPKHRIQSAGEVAAALAAAERGESLAPTELALSGTLGRVLRRRRRAVGWAAVALAGLALAAAGWLSLRPRAGGVLAASRPELRNLAVLPFVNLTGDPKRDYFCEGLSAIFTHQLSAVPGLNVVARSETWAYRGSQKSAKEIGRELGVGAILEGHVRRQGERFHVEASLIDTEQGYVIWPLSLEGSAEEILGAHESLVPELAAHLALPLSEADRARALRPTTQSASAQDLFLRALGLLARVDNPQRFDLATDLLRQALAQDSNFHLARAVLSQNLFAQWERDASAALLAGAEQEARRALAGDSELPDGRIALAQVYSARGDHDKAAQELRHVVALYPKHDSAYLALARAYQAAGDLPRAEQSFNQAAAIRPSYWYNWNELGTFLAATGNAKAARAALEKAAKLAPPDVSWPQQNLGLLALEEGKFEEAVSAFEQVPKPIVDPNVATNVATAYFYSGRLEEAEELFRLAVRLRPNAPRFHGNLGDLLLARDQTTAAQSAYREAARLTAQELAVDPTQERKAFRRAVWLAKAGDCGEPLAGAERLAASLPRTGDNLRDLAAARASCARRDTALAALREAVGLGYPPARIAKEAEFRGLAHEPKFRELVAERPSP